MDNDRLRLIYGDGSSSSNSGANTSPRGGSPLNRALNNQHYSQPASPHNSQPLPPPPGFNSFNSPPGQQFQFPQTPAPGFQNYYTAQNFYAPSFPPNFPHNGLGQSSVPQYSNMPQYYNQSPFVHPMSHMTHHNVYGSNGVNDELEHTMNLLRASAAGAGVPPPSTPNLTRDIYNNSPTYSQHQQQSSAVNSPVSFDANTVIKPMIENIVGARSMSNGTYTHFAPSFSTATPTSPTLPRQSNNQNFSVDSVVSPVQNDSNDVEDNVFPETQLLQIVNRMKEVGVFPTVGSPTPIDVSTPAPLSPPVQVQTHIVHQPVVVNGKESPVNVNNVSVSHNRSTTPKEPVVENISRPQTPGQKPSYLEILTKSGPKGGPTTAIFRKASLSTSPSPTSHPNLSSTNGDSFNQQHIQGSYRKSGDSVLSSTSSTASSSCASASSSPVTKPKLISSNASASFYQNTAKGKENFGTSSANSSGHNSKQSSSKNTPLSTPTHSVGSTSNYSTNLPHGQKQKSSTLNSSENQRKVLISSQNHVPGDKVTKSAKKNNTQQQQNQFEFDIEDLDDENDNGSSWKTAAGKGKSPQTHNNNNSIHSYSNNSKKVPNGNWSGNNATTTNEISNTVTVQANANTTNNSTSSERKSSTTSGYISNASSSSGGSTNSGANNNNSSGGGGGGGGGSSSAQSSRKARDKEKPRSRKEDRNCVVRRVEQLTKVWLGHLVVAVTWLWSLVVDVTVLSFSLGYNILQDLISWWQVKALPTCRTKFFNLKESVITVLQKVRWKGFSGKEKKASEDGGFAAGTAGRGDNDDLLSLMGPERNITLPVNGDEALKRLHSVKGQDPYSILGVRSDCSDETIRRYYKKQAVLVHPDKNVVPGAEEAFKILARAFELVGDPVKRMDYHQKLVQAQAQEKVFGDIGNLFEQLRKKMEAASSSIRCTKCNSRHQKNRTDRPLFAARFCLQCRIHHAAREGDLWAERKGLFGLSWHYFACMDCHIWEINEWAKCQKKNLLHLKPDSHSVMYRLVAGAGNGNQSSQGHGGNTEDQCSGNVEPDNDDWDSLISNLCKGPSCSTSRNGANHHHMGNGSCCAGGTGNSGNAGGAAKKRKGKRK